MSFVGPRPWPIDDYTEEVEQGIYRKTLVKAGLTGLVQVNKGRYEGIEEERALDWEYIDYVKSHSATRHFLYDLKLLALSVRTLFQGKGL